MTGRQDGDHNDDDGGDDHGRDSNHDNTDDTLTLAYQGCACDLTTVMTPTTIAGDTSFGCTTADDDNMHVTTSQGTTTATGRDR